MDVTEGPSPALSLEGVHIQFGGLVAVDHLSLRAAAGQVTGLIGPNGAGKTTTLNAVCGVVPARGSVVLGTTPLDRMGPPARARQGLGRSFQRMQLFDTMTVAENVAMGPEILSAGGAPWRYLVAPRRERVDATGRAREAIACCGLEHLADTAVANLSTGERRLVELARAMASPFRFLLLDEPSSGLDVAETEHFAELLASFVRRGIGILLVEHDMALVRAVCSYIYVLDFGKLIFDGPAADAFTAEIVKDAYLGSDAVEVMV